MDNKKIDKKPGIYKIINKINGKMYIGSSVNCFRRLIREHKYHLLNNKHVNLYLQRAVNKYGIENFEFEVIEYVSDKELLIEREQFYLDKILFASENDEKFKIFGYNIVRIAGRNLGLKWTDERKQKLSNLMKGRYIGDKNPNYNNKWTDEQKQKLSNDRKGLTFDERFGVEKSKKIRLKISENLKGKYVGDKNPLFGVKVSEETKKRISDNLSDRFSGDKSFNYKGGYTKPKNKLELNTINSNDNIDQNIFKSRQCEKNGKPVCQFNSKMELIQKWPSIKTASDNLNISRASIKSCCNGKSRHAGFFIWRFENNLDLEYKYRENIILQLNDNGEIINEFNQIVVAAETLKISRNYIGIALKTGKKYYGFYWKYKTDLI